MTSRTASPSAPGSTPDEAIRPDQPATVRAFRRPVGRDAAGQVYGTTSDAPPAIPARTCPGPGGTPAAEPGGTRAAAVAALLALLVLAFNLRTAITVVPPLLERMTELSLSPAQIGLLGALPSVAFSLAGLVGSQLLRRASAERIAVGVLVVTAVGQAVRPWTGSGAWTFMAVTLAMLLAMGVGNVILPPLVKAYFPGRIGGVTALYTTAVALGTALPPLVAVPVADGRGWHVALTLWAGVAVLALPFWAGLVRSPRTVPPAQRERAARLPLHRSPVAWGLGLLFGMNSLNIYSMFAWLPTRLTDTGASAGYAGAQLALYGAVGVLPSLLMPILAGRVRNTALLVVAVVACYGTGYLGLFLLPTTATSVWVALAGLGAGGFPLALTLVGLRSATPATAGALSGFGQGVGYATAATGPILFGVLHQASGGWALPFAFLGLTLVVMMAAGVMVSGGRTLEQDLAARGA